jgi:histidine triad (HIT) family protein
MYDRNNIFAKIINGDIETKKIYEDDQLVAIHDIKPVAPVHILVIPKGEYVDYADFVLKAQLKEIVHYFKMVAIIAKEHGVEHYRVVCNKGADVGQSVFHFHTHIIGGAKISKLIDNEL